MRTFFYFLIGTLLAACGAAKMAASLTDESLVVGQNIYPDLTMDQLNHGKNVYETQCNVCHALKAFEDYDKTSWDAIVPKMVEKANEKAGTTAIDETDQENLLRYVVTMSESLGQSEEEGGVWNPSEKK